VSSGINRLGMLLKGYPRISEAFISTEILLLESLGVPLEIFSLRQPRESFCHDHVKKIRARVTYLPEYVLPNVLSLFRSNMRLWRKLGAHYPKCFRNAVKRAYERRAVATVRHFLQAGHLAATRLLRSEVSHVHAHFCHTPASVAFFAAELTGLPFSFTAHAKDIYTSDTEQLSRKIRQARFVVTCTRYNAAHLLEIAGDAAIPTPIHTIYHGIDLDLFTFGAEVPPGPPYEILSVGRMVPKKGYDDLLAALKILDEDGVDFRFTHIGSGEEKPRIKALARDLGLSKRVRMLGTLPHRDVIDRYRRSHCFALACKVAENGDRDGIPNVLIEAMAVGLPVVATEVSAIPELVENGKTGTLVKSGNPAAMAVALRQVLEHPEARLNWAAAARKKVEEEFDNRRCILKLHALFRQALGVL
jgi:glycosyltransferase involved in cell wall biosynthesis